MTEHHAEITRRRLLGTAAGVAGALALGGGRAEGAFAALTAPRRGGTFRYGVSDSFPSDSLDYRFTASSAQAAVRARLISSGLTRRRPSGGYELDLASVFEPSKDARSWTVRLHDAEWSNGKPVTADDVIFTLKRQLNKKTAAGAAPLAAAIDPARLKKLDKRTVRINLKYPDVYLREMLGSEDFTLMPVGYNPNKPIGCGPFKLQSFVPGQKSVLLRNDNFWKSGKPYLDRVEMIGFADPGTTRLNAFLNGQVDGIDHVSFSQVPLIASRKNLKVLVSESRGFVSWEMRVDTAPFNDVRVRQAMRLLADRDEIVKQVLGGTRFAKVANDIGGNEFDPMYLRTLPQRERDVERAKFLLKQAGQSDLTVELNVADAAFSVVDTATVLAEQAKDAGVTIKINKLPDVGTYWSKHFYQDPMKFDYWLTISTDFWSRWSQLPGASYNASGYKDPKYAALIKAASTTLDAKKRKQLMADAQRLYWNSGSTAVYAFYKDVGAYSSKFAGMKPNVSSLGFQYLEDVYLA